jgi:hypothetical protein
MAALATGFDALCGRRRLMAAGLGGLAAAVLRPALAATGANPGVAPAVPAQDSLAFQVSRNGSQIGTHRIDFTRDITAVTARIRADFRVGFGFITFYRYHHQGTEQWQGGQFQSLDTATNDNGKHFQVRARRVAGGILIQATGLPDQMAPANALPLTHWAIAAMDAPLFNPQTGKMLREEAQKRGLSTVALADGTRITATGYDLAGEAPIEDWYDKNQIWAALNGRGKDGSAIAYRRISG